MIAKRSALRARDWMIPPFLGSDTPTWGVSDEMSREGLQNGVRCARTGWDAWVYHCARRRAGG